MKAVETHKAKTVSYPGMLIATTSIPPTATPSSSSIWSMASFHLAYACTPPPACGKQNSLDQKRLLL